MKCSKTYQALRFSTPNSGERHARNRPACCGRNTLRRYSAAPSRHRATDATSRPGLVRLSGRLAGRSSGRLAVWSGGRAAERSDGWSIGRVVGRSDSQAVGSSAGRSIGRSVGPPVGQSVGLVTSPQPFSCTLSAPNQHSALPIRPGRLLAVCGRWSPGRLLAVCQRSQSGRRKLAITRATSGMVRASR